MSLVPPPEDETAKRSNETGATELEGRLQEERCRIRKEEMQRRDLKLYDGRKTGGRSRGVWKRSE